MAKTKTIAVRARPGVWAGRYGEPGRSFALLRWVKLYKEIQDLAPSLGSRSATTSAYVRTGGLVLCWLDQLQIPNSTTTYPAGRGGGDQALARGLPSSWE